MGALCNPPPCFPAAPLMTLSDNAGLWPFFAGTPATEADRLWPPFAFACTMDDLLLRRPGGSVTTDCLRSPSAALASDASLSRTRSGDSAMFLKVMIHSTSSPAYTVGSLQRTQARMFEGGAAGGIVREVRLAGGGRNTLSGDHRWLSCGQSSSSRQAVRTGMNGACHSSLGESPPVAKLRWTMIYACIATPSLRWASGAD